MDSGDERTLLQRFNKRPRNTGWSPLRPFLVTSTVGVPILAGVLLPLALQYQLAMRLTKPFRKPQSFPRIEVPKELLSLPVVPPNQRKFDLVLYGASGFVGKLAAQYLARSYGSSVRWAIAGRRRDALEKLRDKLVKEHGLSAEAIEVLVADSNDPKALAELVRSTKVVASSVGPFCLHGTPLVELCAAQGTSYCDTTGETNWVREMIDRFDDTARKTGAKIVHCCGHDSVPWDLTTRAVAMELKKRGENLTEVRCYDEARGGLSGGTAATIFENAGRPPYHGSRGFHPMLKLPSGKPSGCRTADNTAKFMSFSKEIGKWVGPFPMAMVNVDIVRRSNALNQYGPNLRYKEAAVHPGFMAAFVETFSLVGFGTALMFGPLKSVLKKYLPKPGQGPSEKTMDKNYLKVSTIGVGDKGSKARAMIFLPTDPGYRDTARILVESGLCLAKDPLPSTEGGVLTPATAMGDPLLDRLVRTGCVYNCALLPDKK